MGALLLTFSNLGFAYQSGTIRPNEGEEIILFSGQNFSGNKFKTTTNIPVFDSAIRDNLQSIFIPLGGEVIFYEGENFTGNYFTRDSTDSNTLDYGKNIKSMMVKKAPMSTTAVQVFEYTGFQTGGFFKHYEFTESVPELPLELMDNVASLRVPKGWVVRFYHGTNYRGQFNTRGDDYSLYLSSNVHSWGRHSEAMQVLRSPHDVNGVYVYNMIEFWGNESIMTQDTPRFVPAFDVHIYSFKVPKGWEIRFYEDENYQGGYWIFGEGLHERWDGVQSGGRKASSMRILRRKEKDDSLLEIYTGTDFTGEKLSLNQSKLVLDHKFSRKIGSFRVPEEWAVEFFSGEYFTGQKYTRSDDAEDPDFRDIGYDIRSIRIIQR